MKKTQINAIKRIINNNPQRPALQGMFTDDHGRACACDTYRIIRLTAESPDELPPAPGLSVNRFFDVPWGWDLLLPTVEELKAIIKRSNENKTHAVFDFGDDLPQVNARYLLDMLRIFPDATAYRSAKNTKNGAVFFESTFGDGLLMPLRKQ